MILVITTNVCGRTHFHILQPSLCDCQYDDNCPFPFHIWSYKVVDVREDDIVYTRDERDRGARLHGIYINQYTTSFSSEYGTFKNEQSWSPDGLLCEADIYGCRLKEKHRNSLLPPPQHELTLPRMYLPYCNCSPYSISSDFPSCTFYFEGNEYHLRYEGTPDNYVVKSIIPTSVILVYLQTPSGYWPKTKNE